jgi:uncharacterized membrane protein
MQFLTIVKRGFFIPLLFLLITSNLFSKNDINNFILSNKSNLLNQKLIKKINEMGLELNSKTGIYVFLSIQESLNGITIQNFEKNLSKDLPKPFVLMIFSKLDKKIDIISSESIKNKFDKEVILDDYAIPLIVMKAKSGVDINSPYRAGIFNGYAEIIDEIAQSEKVELKSSIGNESKTSTDFLRYFIEITTLIVVIILIFQYINRKKNG